MNKEVIIKFKNIDKKFSDKVIFDNLNLDIVKGKITTIFGESGIGKSLLLKILIGLLKADSGEIYFENEEISKFSERKYITIRKKIAMLFQGGALLDSLSVGENIAYPLRLHFKLKNKEIKKAVKKNLEMVGLSDIEHLRPSELSVGMKKRVALARALATNPSVILYDDPTTGLDPINVNLISELITSLRNDLKITSIIVGNDMNFNLKISDKLAMLDKGKIIFYGNFEDIKESEIPIVKRFIKGINGN